jgi:hypothetical protein
VGTIEHRLYASFPADQFRRGIAIYGKEKEYMKGYKEPGFQDRAAASARAKSSALEKMKSAPKPDEAQLAARAERQAKREAKAAAKRAAKEEAQRLEQEQAIEAKNEQARAEAEVPVLTEADRKAARDARYAARKKRKK